MKAIRGKSAPIRVRSIQGYAALTLMLGAIGCAFSQFQALAATGLVDAAARPLMAPTIATVSPLDERPTGATLGNPLWGISLHAMSATRERPLFSPSRRPPAPVIAAAPPPPPPPSKPPPPPRPSLVLLGTVVGPSESIGVFLDETTKNVVRLRIGEGDHGWTLSAIQLRMAVLKQGQREASLTLSPADGKAQQTASGSPSNPVFTPPQQQTPKVASGGPSNPVPAPPQQQTPIAQPAGKWVDGDGRSIEPPPASRIARGSPPASWVDGDGRVISPPTQKTGIKNRTPPANSWVDGDGQAIAPPPTRIGVRAER